MILTLKNRIMLGVYVMYLLRRLKNPLVMEATAFIVLAAVLSIFVSIPSVISNMLEAESSSGYFLTAFYKTELLVQLVIISALPPLFFLARSLASYTGLRQKWT